MSVQLLTQMLQGSILTWWISHAQRCWDQGGSAAAAAAPNLAALAVLAGDFSTAAAHTEAALSVQQPPTAAYVTAAAVALQVLSLPHHGHAKCAGGIHHLSDSACRTRATVLCTNTQAGDAATARRHCQAALAGDPNCREAHFNLGYVSHQLLPLLLACITETFPSAQAC